MEIEHLGVWDKIATLAACFHSHSDGATSPGPVHAGVHQAGKLPSPERSQLRTCTVREVLREDLKTHIRDYRTILTFMMQMPKKRWLISEKTGNRNSYRPAVRQQDQMKDEIG